MGTGPPHPQRALFQPQDKVAPGVQLCEVLFSAQFPLVSVF